MVIPPPHKPECRCLSDKRHSTFRQIASTFEHTCCYILPRQPAISKPRSQCVPSHRNHRLAGGRLSPFATCLEDDLVSLRSFNRTRFSSSVQEKGQESGIIAKNNSAKTRENTTGTTLCAFCIEDLRALFPGTRFVYAQRNADATSLTQRPVRPGAFAETAGARPQRENEI